MTDDLRRAYRTMRTIRTFGRHAHSAGYGPRCAGEEASAAGVCLHLDDRDAVSGGHGHRIARGADVRSLVAELHGRRTGPARGEGGSRLLGGDPPLICGTALAAKRQGTGGVGVAFFGDGVGNRGTTLEALSLASVWNLPAVFVAEHDGYAGMTSSSWSVASDNVADRAAAFGVPGVIVDGFDFFAVHEAAGEAIGRARDGGGPTLIEIRCTRHRRDGGDCLTRFRARVTESGELDVAVLDGIDAEVAKLVEDSVAEALAAPEPTAADLETDVYVSY